MADLIVTPAALAVASGGWFAAKVLGPAADSAGKSLAEFFNARLEKIFRKADTLTEPADPKPLPTGFLYLVAQKASFSEDSEILTDMWASLLVSASQETDHRHALFADVLTQIGGEAARLLLELVRQSHWSFDFESHGSLERMLYDRYRSTLDWEIRSPELAREKAQDLLGRRIGWPVRVTRASYNWYDGSRANQTSGIETVGASEIDSYQLDVLVRQRLIEEFEFDFSPGWASPVVAGTYLTRLGKEFLETCHAHREDLAP